MTDKEKENYGEKQTPTEQETWNCFAAILR